MIFKVSSLSGAVYRNRYKFNLHQLKVSHLLKPFYNFRSVPVKNYVVVPYSPVPHVYHHQQQPQPQEGPVDQPPTTTTSLAAQPIVPDVPHYVHPTHKTVIPSGPPPQLFYHPSHAHSYPSPHHPSYPATVPYAPSYLSHGPVFPHGHNYNYYTPSLDLFGQYSRHTSLLDSYVPSSLVYAKARQVFGSPYYNHAHSTPAIHHPAIIPRGISSAAVEYSPAYNTIAYSTEQKPVVVPPPSAQVQKRESTVLKAAAPLKPNKPAVAITKMDSVGTKGN